MATKVISGGQKLEEYLKSVSGKVDKTRTLNVGFLSGATYTNKEHTPVAMVAAIQEFGAPKAGIPPRSFFRTMVAAKSPNWGNALAIQLKNTEMDAEKSLSLMGKAISEQLQLSIIALVAPPLSPVTLMLREMRHKNPGMIVNATTVVEARERVAKGESYAGASTKPLEDTKTMLKSVAYEVK